MVNRGPNTLPSLFSKILIITENHRLFNFAAIACALAATPRLVKTFSKILDSSQDRTLSSSPEAFRISAVNNIAAALDGVNETLLVYISQSRILMTAPTSAHSRGSEEVDYTNHVPQAQILTQNRNDGSVCEGVVNSYEIQQEALTLPFQSDIQDVYYVFPPVEGNSWLYPPQPNFESSFGYGQPLLNDVSINQRSYVPTATAFDHHNHWVQQFTAPTFETGYRGHNFPTYYVPELNSQQLHHPNTSIIDPALLQPPQLDISAPETEPPCTQHHRSSATTFRTQPEGIRRFRRGSAVTRHGRCHRGRASVRRGTLRNISMDAVTCVRCGASGHRADDCALPFVPIPRYWPYDLRGLAQNIRESLGVPVEWC